MITNVREWLADSKKRGMDLGLERVFRIYQSLIQINDNTTILHVAGSNGKGTLCATLATHLHQIGQSTVMFTSPHLVRIEERVRLDGSPIASDQFDAFLSMIQEAELVLDEALTFFEITFLVACLCADRNNVDVFIVETGLGGRFDATRILQADVSILTSLSVEHRDVLGDTLAQIAAEKAAIARPGMPMIVRNVLDSEARESIEFEAKNAGRFELNETKAEASIQWVVIPETASFEQEAMLIAKATLESLSFDTEGLEKSIQMLNWPGRFQELPAPWPGSILFDAAHNPSGLLRMLPQLRNRIEQEDAWTLVFGCTPQHDLVEFAKPLLDLCEQKPPRSIVLTKPHLGRYEGVSLQSLRELDWPASSTIYEQENAQETHSCLIGIEPPFTVAIGSLYLIGELYESFDYWGMEHMELFPAKTQRDEA